MATDKGRIDNWDGEPYYPSEIVARLAGYSSQQTLRNAISLGRFTVKSSIRRGKRVFNKKDFDRFMDERKEKRRQENRKAYMKWYREKQRLRKNK